MAAILTTLSAVSCVCNTANQLSSTQVYASTVIIYADNLNTGNIYLGGPTVTSANGLPIAKNQSENITYDMVYGVNGKIDLSKIYFDSDTTGNKVRVTYIGWVGG